MTLRIKWERNEERNLHNSYQLNASKFSKYICKLIKIHFLRMRYKSLESSLKWDEFKPETSTIFM